MNDRRATRPSSVVAFALAALAAPFVLGAAAARPPAAPEVAPPLPLPDGADFADPFVLREGATYFAYATGSGGAHLQAARASDLDRWTRLPDPLPRLPAWADDAPGLTWAPAVLRRGDRWVLYFTSRDRRSGFQCIGRATSATPEGPFVDESAQPLVCQVDGDEALCGSIDPSPYVDETGRAFLVWKSDENASACRGRARLWSRALDAAGFALVGSSAELLRVDQPWEAPLVEGPSLVRAGGGLHLFYSAGWYDGPTYAIGHARCASPLGPCSKTTLAAPLVGSDAVELGPGGQELFTDTRGDLWMAYHAWSAAAPSYAAGGARGLRLARVLFPEASGGLPRIRRPGPGAVTLF